MIELFAVDGLSVYVILAWFIFMVWIDWVSDETAGASIALGTASLAVIAILTYFDFLRWDWVPSINPIYAIIVYIGSGVAFAIAKWRYSFIPAAKGAFDRASPLRGSLPSKYWPQEQEVVKTSPAYEAWYEWRNADFKSNKLDFVEWKEKNPSISSIAAASDYAPLAKYHKTRVANWVVFWPPYAVFHAIKDPIRWIGNLIYSVLGNTFDRLSRDAFGEKP